MPGADGIHSLLWKEQQWLTGSLRAKNKSGLSRHWCAARVPLVVSPGAAWFAHSFLMSHERLLALMLIHLLVVFGVSAAALEVICALAEVVNSKSLLDTNTKIKSDNHRPPGAKVRRVLSVWRDGLVPVVVKFSRTSWGCTGINPTCCKYHRDRGRVILCINIKYRQYEGPLSTKVVRG